MGEEIITPGELEATPAAELTIVTSKKKIRRLFGSTSSTDMFFDGHEAPVGKDVTKHPWFDVFLSGGFTSISHGNGGFSKEYGVPLDTLHIGGAGNGWNGVEPRNCEEYQGELCADYRVGSANLDFWNSHMILRKRMGADNYIIANMFKGGIEQLYRQIDQTLPQQSIFIQFCEETNNAQWSNGANYAATCYAWQSDIERKYPEQSFRFVFDVPTLWDGRGRTWADQIASVKPIDKKKWCIRQYCHAFQMWELTGDIAKDVEIIDYTARVTLPEFTKAIEDSPFVGCKVFLGQVSSNENAYTPQANKGVQYLVNFYGRMTKHWFESLIIGKVKYCGQCVIGMNTFIDKQTLVPKLDFVSLSIDNKLYVKGLKAATFSEIDPAVDIYGGSKNGTNYRFVMQNRKGVEVALPKTISFDGKVLQIAPTKARGIDYGAVDSTTYVEFDPMERAVLPPYSKAFFEFKI